ncbi:hypothetical protein AV521_03495 [Streptomyces sp. IMTB 2501]|nr:hypothetical protein AV521_03495 [Streptomyces sp. IMTB 2501]
MIELVAAFAVAGAAGNAVGTAFQRRAASAGSRGGLRPLAELVRRPPPPSWHTAPDCPRPGHPHA